MSIVEQQERARQRKPLASAGPLAVAARSRRAVRARLLGLGVPGSVLQGADVEELRQLASDLDRFSAFGYDAATQRRFLREPHPALQGYAPIELLAQPGGIARVHEALRRTLRALAR